MKKNLRNMKIDSIINEKLYIIGNGFDLHHGINTSYANFRDCQAKKSQQLWSLFTTIYGDAPNQDMWWWNFEEMLGRIDYNHLMNSYNGLALSPTMVNNLLKGMLPPLFSKWLRTKSVEIINMKPLLEDVIDPKALFFSFNYTPMLEIVYNIDQDNIWHIHHSIEDEKKGKGQIVVGHDSDDRKLFLDFLEYEKLKQVTRQDVASNIRAMAANGAKGVANRINRHIEDFYQRYSNIKHYIVMGFSFNDIDMPYIEQIVRVNGNIASADWKVYWHSEGEDELMKKKLMIVGINENAINTINW